MVNSEGDKVREVERKLDDKPAITRDMCSIGKVIVINSHAPYFNHEKAGIAYIGDKGVSAYLTNVDFDECITLEYGEFDFDR